MAKWKEFPEHVVVEILLKSSVKSLIRLCCVSKKFCALIKNSNFTSMYSKCNKQDILLVLREVEGENHNVISFYSSTDRNFLTLTQVSTDLRSLYFHNENPIASSLYLTGPCNCLICVSDDLNNIVLCNLVLQELKLLPPTTFSCRRGLVLNIMGLGLGFDPCTNDYKVVRIVEMFFPGMITDDEDEDEVEDEEKDEEGIKAELYDLGTNSWRKIEAQVPFFSPYASFEFFYKGCCHIGAFHTTICFNISSENFTTINYPQCLLDSYENLELLINDPPGSFARPIEFLTVLNDCLTLVSYEHCVKEPKLIDIWVLKEYGNQESWVKQFTIGPILVKSTLSSWRNDFILFEGENKKLICCELDANKVTKFEIYCHREYAMEAVIFRENLISIH